ncbi:MAG TPA: thioesterase family protein [Acidimicrobiales bacterium]
MTRNLTDFDLDTALEPTGDGRFTGAMSRRWWIERGPNGGYVAAIVLRGLMLTVDDAARTPRSLTVHYLAPPQEGPVTMETRVERAGRQVSFLSGRLLQGDRLLAVAQAAFALPMPGVEFCDVQPPSVPPPDVLTRMSPNVAGGPAIPMRERYDMRWALGAAPFTGSDEAVAGGWIRLAQPRECDHILLAALTDAWMPPVFSRSTERMGVPTVDLTVHFRAPLHAVNQGSDDFYLCMFRSQMAADGFVEEDGEVWSRDGVLLAHSRQLAMLLPLQA